MERDFRERADKLRNKRTGSCETLCSYCGNATNDGCSWSESLTPVEGWEAVQNKNGWFVVDCPEAVSDRWMHEKPSELDTEGCMLLMEAIARQMRDDYMYMPKKRPYIERFIRSDYCHKLFGFSNPEAVIEQMRKGMRRNP